MYWVENFIQYILKLQPEFSIYNSISICNLSDTLASMIGTHDGDFISDDREIEMSFWAAQLK